MAKISDSRLIKQCMKAEPSGESTHVVVVSVHNDNDRNSLQKIDISEGTCLAGYIYDSLEDCYYYKFKYSLDLGSIPISFCLSMESAKWKIHVPMSEEVIRRHLNVAQTAELEKFLTDHSAESTITFLQFLGC